MEVPNGKGSVELAPKSADVAGTSRFLWLEPVIRFAEPGEGVANQEPKMGNLEKGCWFRKVKWASNARGRGRGVITLGGEGFHGPLKFTSELGSIASVLRYKLSQ